MLAILSGERPDRSLIVVSTDHRCIDGALGAEFIGAIKAYLEEPGLMLV
jgi:pyruvate dehydrogenase E2 component (dihydrolipoamide acetyltransferase)